MKTIFSDKRAVGFDFDHTLANIDKFHKQAWLDVVEALGLELSTKELFIWPVSSYARFDNFSNIYACFFENQNITLTKSELLKRVKALSKKLKVGMSAKSDIDMAVCLYYCKEALLQRTIADQHPNELEDYLLPDCRSFLSQLAATHPKALLYVASSTSTASLTTFLSKTGLNIHFGLIVGEDLLREVAADAWSLRDKPESSSAKKVFGLLRARLPRLRPEEVLYVGDDSVRDGEFAAAMGATYIQLAKLPTSKTRSLYLRNYSELSELLDAPLLKVCRVKDLHTARYLARWGVDFIGLHAIYELPGAKELHALKQVTSEMSDYYPRTKTVLVSRSENAESLTQIATAIPVQFIQFHSGVDAKFKRKVLATLNKNGHDTGTINVVSAQQGGEGRSKLVGPYVLIDQNFHGGTGVAINNDLATNLAKQVNKPGRTIFLAGGINPDNAASRSQAKPVSALDVQSGLETPLKTKDINKVRAIIGVLYPKRRLANLPGNKQLVALSLQEQAATGKIIDVSSTDIDLLHADFSDGKQVPNWSVDSIEAVRYWQKTNPFIPVDLHLFSDSYATVMQKILEYQQAHSNIRCIILHAETAKSLATVRKIIASQPELQWGLSINYNLGQDFYDELCGLLRDHMAITDLLICLPGKHKETWQFDINAVKLLRRVAKFAQTRTLCVGIDRDVDPHRVSLAAKYGVRHFVVGKYLQQGQDISARLNHIRRSYAHAHSSNH